MNTVTKTSTRRSILKGSAAALAGAALVSTTAKAATSDPHPVWLAELTAMRAEGKKQIEPIYRDLEKRFAGHRGTEDHIRACVAAVSPAAADFSNRHGARAAELERLILSTPAKTVAGIKAQVGMACDRSNNSSALYPSYDYWDVLRAVEASLAEMA
ncbi:hypothetical protein HH303_18895 [Rhodospirillaceae bacterium KN72]|uniref:Twin-arginine translocation signal domain-containing protein n=1 Tax=Pacificispira spongiicola TaxID=2729598 RepID=A0A7Y0HG65_9PROT|nr:hypothetical protein [Pacificispira spongiicola]NMM46566.1 hypothetical protein [Pacificispira spongiicola]